MPYRKTILATNEVYHTVSRSIAQAEIFNTQRDYARILDVINFYRFENIPLSYSHYHRLPIEERKKFMQNLNKHENIVDIIAFSLMPNHLHLLLKQLKERGVSIFMSNFQNSYARYFNTKYERRGSLFQSMFRAVRIGNDNQLLHVSRYIHLNPVTAYLIELNQLKQYLWTSFPAYASGKPEDQHEFLKPQYILDMFRNRNDYTKFVQNQSDYQKELQKIKRLTLDN